MANTPVSWVSVKCGAEAGVGVGVGVNFFFFFVISFFSGF